jgi:hypothetical protein
MVELVLNPLTRNIGKHFAKHGDPEVLGTILLVGLIILGIVVVLGFILLIVEFFSTSDEEMIFNDRVNDVGQPQKYGETTTEYLIRKDRFVREELRKAAQATKPQGSGETDSAYHRRLCEVASKRLENPRGLLW